MLVDFLHGVAVSLQRMVLTALGFIEYSFLALAGEHRLHVDPTTVHVTADTGGGFRIAPHRTHGRLQFRCGRPTIGRSLDEQGFEFRVPDVFSASLESGLTVLAGFNQVVEYRNGFFIHVGHFSIPRG
ncbi:hypothetical protein D3C76_1423550 [compost metagenome]